nr:MAG TPA: dUTPase [Caudoviricetes sp.]
MKKKITILYHKKQMSRIEKISKGDWIDLRLAETVTLKKGEYQLLSLGVSIQLPKGYEALVAPRSSTFKNYGILLANSIGIIDETYCGDDDIWRFPALATRDITIPADTRIAQFRIIKHQPKIEFIIADKLSNSNRGGIGSTGTK